MDYEDLENEVAGCAGCLMVFVVCAVLAAALVFIWVKLWTQGVG